MTRKARSTADPAAEAAAAQLHQPAPPSPAAQVPPPPLPPARAGGPPPAAQVPPLTPPPARAGGPPPAAQVPPIFPPGQPAQPPGGGYGAPLGTMGVGAGGQPLAPTPPLPPPAPGASDPAAQPLPPGLGGLLRPVQGQTLDRFRPAQGVGAAAGAALAAGVIPAPAPPAEAAAPPPPGPLPTPLAAGAPAAAAGAAGAGTKTRPMAGSSVAYAFQGPPTPAHPRVGGGPGGGGSGGASGIDGGGGSPGGDSGIGGGGGGSGGASGVGSSGIGGGGGGSGRGGSGGASRTGGGSAVGGPSGLMPGQGIPRSTEELDIEGIRITTGEPHFILKVAREAYKKSGKTGEPDHKTLQEWCNSRDGYKAHLSKALNDAIEAGIRDGSRTVLSSEKKPNGGKVFRNEHGGELEETVVPGKGIRFNAKGNFTGQIQIPRVGKDNKHIPGAFDVVDFENGKVVSRVYAKAPNGQPIGKSQLDKAYLDEQMGIDTGTRVVAASTRSSAERAIVDTGIVVAAPPGSLVPSATPGGPAQTPGQGVGGGGGGRGGV